VAEGDVPGFESSISFSRPGRTSRFQGVERLSGSFRFRRGPRPTDLQSDFATCQKALGVLVTGPLPLGDGQAFVKVFPGAPRAAPGALQAGLRGELGGAVRLGGAAQAAARAGPPPGHDAAETSDVGRSSPGPRLLGVRRWPARGTGR